MRDGSPLLSGSGAFGVRNGGPRSHLFRGAGSRLRLPGRRALLLLALVIAASCRSEEPDPELLPDALLQAELGLTEADRVYRIAVGGGEREERVDPIETVLEPGSYVQFATVDWLVHEVIFEADSLSAEAHGFMRELGQLASPPLVNRDSRFVVSFVDAPPARYPFRIEGNHGVARGVLVVRDPSEAPGGS